MTDPSSNAKWILSVLWQMQGIDVQLDTNIGRCLTALTKTMTMMAAGEDEDDMFPAEEDVMSLTSDDSDMELVQVCRKSFCFVYFLFSKLGLNTQSNKRFMGVMLYLKTDLLLQGNK